MSAAIATYDDERLNKKICIHNGAASYACTTHHPRDPVRCCVSGSHREGRNTLLLWHKPLKSVFRLCSTHYIHQLFMHWLIFLCLATLYVYIQGERRRTQASHCFAWSHERQQQEAAAAINIWMHRILVRCQNTLGWRRRKKKMRTRSIRRRKGESVICQLLLKLQCAWDLLNRFRCIFKQNIIALQLIPKYKCFTYLRIRSLANFLSLRTMTVTDQKCARIQTRATTPPRLPL